ncbi:MAG: hypothetical protein O2809_05305 [Proteobacteria bacterium]|nr:hypothetical protein [Pseudomonadota bacterium]
MSKRLLRKIAIHGAVVILVLVFLLYIAIPQYVQGLGTEPYLSSYNFLVQVIVLTGLAYVIPPYIIQLCDMLIERFNSKPNKKETK